MYVIQGTIPANQFGSNLVTDIITIPADACIWQITPAVGGGYSISDVYYVGHSGASTFAISAAQFGSVSKTGRFVKHTV
jgi:hypothetical protein